MCASALAPGTWRRTQANNEVLAECDWIVIHGAAKLSVGARLLSLPPDACVGYMVDCRVYRVLIGGSMHQHKSSISFDAFWGYLIGGCIGTRLLSLSLSPKSCALLFLIQGSHTYRLPSAELHTCAHHGVCRGCPCD